VRGTLRHFRGQLHQQGQADAGVLRVHYVDGGGPAELRRRAGRIEREWVQPGGYSKHEDGVIRACEALEPGQEGGLSRGSTHRLT
jgi:hypothetical protein